LRSAAKPVAWQKHEFARESTLHGAVLSLHERCFLLSFSASPTYRSYLAAPFPRSCFAQISGPSAAAAIKLHNQTLHAFARARPSIYASASSVVTAPPAAAATTTSTATTAPFVFNQQQPNKQPLPRHRILYGCCTRPFATPASAARVRANFSALTSASAIAGASASASARGTDILSAADVVDSKTGRRRTTTARKSAWIRFGLPKSRTLNLGVPFTAVSSLI
jgi:hypothetical protein